MEDNKIIELENILKDNDVPEGSIDQIRNLFIDKERVSLQPILKHETEDDLKTQISNEPDWRKRAALSARIISKSLE